MSEILALTAEARKELGKGASRALRKRGMVPITIYGAGKKPVSLSVQEKELTKYYRKPQYISQLIEFRIGKEKYTVLPKAIELHPTTEMVRHADFVFLEKEMQKMQVPVVYTNKDVCVGIKRGGYFNTARRLITILCPIANLPRSIEIDTSELEISASIQAKDAPLPKGAKLLGDPNFVIASIIGKRGKSDDLGDDDGAPAEGGGDAAKAEDSKEAK
ncbi:MAG: 50S ribosomal protein L25/general stress protein Ctc [Rickettsiales bacterium]|nr:MAG: 50S ribosomal protein L25/general stress protein Ctc [Rickettsiales bacterium]